MAIRDVPLPASTAAVPPAVASFLREADQRIERFRIDHVVPGFVPSDFGRVYHVLRGVAECRLAPGRAFCEWGSGFGVVASLAAMLDFEAYGIEIEPALVDAAQALADDFGVPVEFAAGSFVPEGGDAYLEGVREMAWLDGGGGDAHEQLGLDPDDFDVIFAYPWPGEEGVIEGLFDEFAAGGAILMTYHGVDDIRLRRKAFRRRR